jgi:hypothetical protein
VSCKKELPDPNDDGAISCGQGYPLEDWVLVTKFENEPADLGPTALLFKRSFMVENYQPSFPENSVLLCGEIGEAKFKNLEYTYIFTQEYLKKPRYAYRVWGRIFWARHIVTFTGTPILFAQVDKIEKKL